MMMMMMMMMIVLNGGMFDAAITYVSRKIVPHDYNQVVFITSKTGYIQHYIRKVEHKE
jgi:hypothetical protein